MNIILLMDCESEKYGYLLNSTYKVDLLLNLKWTSCNVNIFNSRNPFLLYTKDIYLSTFVDLISNTPSFKRWPIYFILHRWPVSLTLDAGWAQLILLSAPWCSSSQEINIQVASFSPLLHTLKRLFQFCVHSIGVRIHP